MTDSAKRLFTDLAPMRGIYTDTAEYGRRAVFMYRRKCLNET